MDLHTNDSSESAAGVFVSDKCQIPVGGIPQQEPDRQQYYMALCRQKVQEISDKLGRPLTCFISTFGCQMNAHDSEKLLGILLEAGFVEGTSEESDFVLYNTCTVRENANLRVYGRLGLSSQPQEKESPHDDRTLRLHDAGAGGGGEIKEELPLCGLDLRHPQCI